MRIEAKIMGDKEVRRKIEILAKKNNEELRTVIQKAVIIIEGLAKEYSPYEFGALRASITHDVKSTGKKHTGRVGTDIDYGPYQEFGTSKMAAQPYLFPALKDSRRDIITLLEKAIKGIKV